MVLTDRSKCVLVTAVIIGCLGGCGGPSSSTQTASGPNQAAALQEVGEMYRAYLVQKKKPPTSVKDFKGMEQIAPLGMSQLSEGKIVAVWGVQLTDLSEEGSNDSSTEVLAYAKDVPEKGGEVLMKNRTVKTMTADEFKAAPKAAGK